MRMRRLLAVAAVPLLIASVGCSDKDKDEDEGSSAAASCDGLLKPADATATLPGTIPVGVTGATFYSLETQGATKRYFAHVEGSDFVKVRDDIKAAFEAKSIEIEGTDQEEVEAEFEFKVGTEEGSVQVVPLCKDHLRIRFRIGPK